MKPFSLLGEASQLALCLSFPVRGALLAGWHKDTKLGENRSAIALRRADAPSVWFFS